jgi:hypothetical protein
MVRHNNIFVHVLMLMVGLLVTGCEAGNTENANIIKLEQKVSSLESEIKQVRNSRDEEQLAIMSYILFVDSLEKKMNGILINYTLLANNQELRTNDRKNNLIRQLDMIQDKITTDKKRIENLENKIIHLQQNDNNSALIEIIERYKNQRKQMERKIIELHSRISNLQQQVIEREATIKRQDIVIEKQQTTIKHKEETIAKQQASLDANYVLLVGRDTFFKVNVKNNELLIPQKKRRINVLNDYNNYCNLTKYDNNLSLLKIDNQLWNEIRYLVVEIKGEF